MQLCRYARCYRVMFCVPWCEELVSVFFPTDSVDAGHAASQAALIFFDAYNVSLGDH